MYLAEVDFQGSDAGAFELGTHSPSNHIHREYPGELDDKPIEGTAHMSDE
jgi:hypothetical protein